MDVRTVLDRLETICARVFRRGSVQLTSASTAVDVDGWDSLSHVQLLLEVEKAFAIKFSMREAMKLANVGALAALILQKTGRQAA